MNILKQKNNTSSYHKLEGALDSRKLFHTIHAASFKNFITSLVFLSLAIIVNGQQTETDPIAIGFRKTLHDRSVKIINTLEITDSDKYNKVVEFLTNQYFNLNKIHDRSKESVAAIKSLQLSDEERNTRVKKEEEEKKVQLSKLHKGFIAQLQTSLSDDQIEKIKDGMTYRVVPITYSAYQDIILTLTTEQKEKIYNWLKEARELAMDEGSSEDKHKVFGKFKGRINNYLSAQGYDMKKEEKAWQERIKEREASKNNNAG